MMCPSPPWLARCWRVSELAPTAANPPTPKPQGIPYNYYYYYYGHVFLHTHLATTLPGVAVHLTLCLVQRFCDVKSSFRCPVRVSPAPPMNQLTFTVEGKQDEGGRTRHQQRKDETRPAQIRPGRHTLAEAHRDLGLGGAGRQCARVPLLCGVLCT